MSAIYSTIRVRFGEDDVRTFADRTATRDAVRRLVKDTAQAIEERYPAADVEVEAVPKTSGFTTEILLDGERDSIVGDDEVSSIVGACWEIWSDNLWPEDIEEAP